MIFIGVGDESRLFLIHIGTLFFKTLWLLPFAYVLFSTTSTPRRQIVGQPLLVNTVFQADCIWFRNVAAT